MLSLNQGLKRACAGLGGSVGCVKVCLTSDQEVAGLTPQGWQHSLMEIDHEIIYFLWSFFKLPLIQEGQKNVNCIED